jgi:hypothetical protein
MTTDDHYAFSFGIADGPVTPDPETAQAIDEAVAAIERAFVGGADWPRVVASLRLMRLIVEKPPSICRRCRMPFRLEHGAAFALYRRCLKLPKHCAGCRAVRRQERSGQASPNAPPEGRGILVDFGTAGTAQHGRRDGQVSEPGRPDQNAPAAG